jgi:hypothetical protein
LADQLESQKETDARYGALAKRYNVDVGSVLDARFAAGKPSAERGVAAVGKKVC